MDPFQDHRMTHHQIDWDRHDRLGPVRYDRITIDPDQMGGVPCIRGLRIPVATVVGLLADGKSEAEVLRLYPGLEPADILEALRYAADALGMDLGRIRARVQNGRLVVDEPTELPEGTVLDLVVDDEGDDLSEEDRRLLHEAIQRGWRSLEAGKGIPATEVLRELRAR
jgi:uncharacterized protein (DUF433 family)